MTLVPFIPSSKVLATDCYVMVAKLLLFSDTATKINKKSRKHKTTGSLILKNPFSFHILPPFAFRRGAGGERLESFEVLEAILANFVKSFTHNIRLLNETIPRSVISCLTCLQRY
jgi:hypothetical protein